MIHLILGIYTLIRSYPSPFSIYRENLHALTPSANSDTTTIKEDDARPASVKEVKGKKDKKNKDLLFGCIPVGPLKAFFSQPNPPKGVEA